MVAWTRYKLELDNTLRLLSEQHTGVLAAVAAGIISLQGAELNPTEWDEATTAYAYDLIAVGSFLAMVALPFIINILAKMIQVTSLHTISSSRAAYIMLILLHHLFLYGSDQDADGVRHEECNRRRRRRQRQRS